MKTRKDIIDYLLEHYKQLQADLDASSPVWEDDLEKEFQHAHDTLYVNDVCNFLLIMRKENFAEVINRDLVIKAGIFIDNLKTHIQEALPEDAVYNDTLLLGVLIKFVEISQSYLHKNE